jgi:glycosyltransferase involved in cell wall biosynthesis
MKKVSFVCTTFRRFFCVERLISQFYAQTYPNKELIIFNTDVEFPLSLDFEDPSIIVVNSNNRYSDGSEYKNRGEICQDAVTHASGDYFMLADDDDIYLPWHFSQAVDGIEENGKDAWKPERSFFATQEKLEMCMNTLEASVIVKMERIREIGFRQDLTGYEGLSWYTQLRNERELDEHNTEYVSSYCFNWSDPAEIAGHKQSGDIGNPDNFRNHKERSRDHAKRALSKNFDLETVYRPYFEYISKNKSSFSETHFNKYASPFVEKFFSNEL